MLIIVFKLLRNFSSCFFVILFVHFQFYHVLQRSTIIVEKIIVIQPWDTYVPVQNNEEDVM